MENIEGSQKTKEHINILILGETGVGKSTFINGFYNYLTFNSLDDAERAEKLLSIINSSFVLTEPKTFKPIIVNTGTCDDGGNSSGQSVSRIPQVYCFELEKIVVRIIDTPGIGDTRGITKDTENFQNILRTIINYEYLHGVLILLKPNHARLGVFFKYCIEELLTHLHKSAVDNVVFGITNSRSTFFAPGDSMPILQDLLKRNKVGIRLCRDNIYCFDSESYRFLAARRQGNLFKEDDKTAFRDSWERSVAETNRLIDHIINLDPHLINDTINLNNARNFIIQLSKPMAEFTRLIEVNKRTYQDKMKQLEETRKKGNDLENQMKVRTFDLEKKTLGYSRTVCSNSSCIKIFNFRGVQKIDYITHCHSYCNCVSVALETRNNAGLMNCGAMRNGWCQTCGHGYQEHIHVQYESVRVEKIFQDLSFDKQFKENKSLQEQMQNFINGIDIRLSEYEYEHRTTENAAAGFAFFVKQNALLAYSVGRIEYLDHCLREEKTKATLSEDYRLFNAMERMKSEYVKQKEIIEALTFDRDADLFDPEIGQIVVRSLFKLRHFGKNLGNMDSVCSTITKNRVEEIRNKINKNNSMSQL